VPVQNSLEVARLRRWRDLLRRNNLSIAAKAISRVITTAPMLRYVPLEIFRRPDLVSSDFSAENVNPSHKRDWVDWDSHPQPTPKAFGAALFGCRAQNRNRQPRILLSFRLQGEYVNCYVGVA